MQYLTHQILTDKNSSTERTANFGTWKHHTTKQRTTKQPRTNSNTRTNGKSRKFKENYEQ